MNTKDRARGWLKAGALGLSGLVVGAVLAGALSATADDDTRGTSDDGARSGGRPGAFMGNHADPSQPLRHDEHLLNDSLTARVEETALARYPGATVVRIESDSDGVYEAHLTRSDGTPVTVEVNKRFEITGEEAGHGPGGHGGGG